MLGSAKEIEGEDRKGIDTVSNSAMSLGPEKIPRTL
jgi:hypothetical protein